MASRLKIWALTALVAVCAAVSAADAQTCQVTEGDIGAPPFMIRVNERAYVATTKDGMAELAGAKAGKTNLETEIAGLTAIIKKHEEESAQAQKVLDQMKTSIAHLEQQNNGLKSLLLDYKRIVGSKQAWMTFDAAVGETGDSDPAAMAGVGIWKFRVWKYIQKGNGGWLAGVSLPIF